MPDDSRIEVVIAADTSGLQSGMSQAASVTSAATDKIRVSAADMAKALEAAGGNLSKITPAMLGAGTAATQAASSISATAEATAKIAPAAEAAAAGASHMHGSISTATREFRALFDELSSGRTRMLPGTLAIIGTRVLGLGPAALGAVAGVAALAGGLAYLAVSGAKAANALASIKIGAEFAGNLDITTTQISALRDQLSSLGLSSKDADTVIGAFARMKDATTPEIKALSAVVTDYASAVDVSSDKAAAALAKMFSSSEKASHVVASLGGITPAMKDQAAQADASGNATAIFAAKMDALNAALQRARGSIDKQNSSITNSFSALLGLAAAASQGVDASRVTTLYTEAETEARKRLTAAYKESTAAIAASAAQTITAPPIATMKANAPSGAANANDAVSYWKQELATAEQYGGDVQGVMRELNTARQEAAKVAQEAARKEAEAAKEAARQEEMAARKVAEAAKQVATEQTRSLQQAYRAQMEIVRQAVEQEKRAVEEAQRAQKEAAEQSARAWNQAIEPIDRALDGMLSGVLQGTQTMGQAMKRAADNMALSFIEALAKITVKILAFEALKAASGLGGAIGGIAGAGAVALGGNAGGAGSPATGLMAELPKFLSQMLGIGGGGGGGGDSGGAGDNAGFGAGGSAAAGASSATSLPSADDFAQMTQAVTSNTTATTAHSAATTASIVQMVINEAATVANTAALIISAVKSLIPMATGAWNIQSITPALLHPGEMVLPAHVAATLRGAGSSIAGAGVQPLFGAAAVAGGSGGSSAGGGGGAGTPTIAPSVNVTALDSRSVSTLLNNPSTIRNLATQIQRHLAMNPSKQGAF